MVTKISYYTYDGVKREIRLQGLDLVEGETLFAEGVMQLDIPVGLRLPIGKFTYLVNDNNIEMRDNQMLMYDGNRLVAVEDELFINYLEHQMAVNKIVN